MKKPFAKIGFILLIGVIGVQTFSCSSTDTPDLPPPEQTTSSSSDGTSQGYAFCVFPELKYCDPGNFTSCPTGGMPMNSCPYTSGGESSTSAGDASSSSSTDDTLSSSSDAGSSSGGNVSTSSSSGVVPSSSSSVPPPSSSSVALPSSSSSSVPQPSSSSVPLPSSSSVALPSSSSSSIGVPCAGFVDGTTRLHYNKQKAQFCDARDDKKYVYVEINSQTWMAEDLAYGNIPSGSTSHKYNLADANQVCPSGWRLPSVDEWKALVDFANAGNSSSMYQFLMAAQKLKAASGWNVVGTDDYGFSALPNDGNARSIWWSSTGNTPDMDGSTWYFNTSPPTTLRAVRCIKGDPITPPPSSSSSSVSLPSSSSSSSISGICDGEKNLSTYCPGISWGNIQWNGIINIPGCYYVSGISGEVACAHGMQACIINGEDVSGWHANISISKIDNGYYIYVPSTGYINVSYSVGTKPACAL